MNNMLEIITTSGALSLLAYGILFSCFGDDAFSEDKSDRFSFWKMTVWYWVAVAFMTWLLLIFRSKG